MPSLQQASFTGGEVSPSLYARTDLARYQTALRICENFLVMRQGGVMNRPGTRFVSEVKDSAHTVRLVPFIFSDDQTYILEFGDRYIRFYRDGGVVVAVPGTNVAVWSGATAYIIGDFAYRVISLVVTIFRCISNNTNKTPESEPTYWVQDDTYEVASPYLTADLADLQYTQSADLLTVVHPSYPPYELRRHTDTYWTMSAQARTPSIAAPTILIATAFDASTPQKDYQYVATAVSATGQESVASTPVSITVNLTSAKPVALTWTPATGAITYNVYRARNGIFGYIGSTTTAAFKDDDIVPIYTDTPPTWEDPFTSTDNYPSVVAYYQQRLCYAATNTDPETVWMSRAGDYANFGTSSPPKDDDRIKFTMAAQKVQQVRHLVPLDRLIILTASGEWLLLGGQDDVITPASVSLRTQGARGSNAVPPLIIGPSAIYLQRQGRIVRELAYSLEQDKFTGQDLTVMATHLFDGQTVVDWAYAEEPHSIVWAVRDDGLLLGFTYMREQDVWGWHRHPMDGTVENVAVIPEDGEDVLYCVVLRTVDGADVRYVERLHSRVIDDLREDAFFVDCGLSYRGFDVTAVNLTVSGLAGAAGAAFEITAAGAVWGSAAVGDIVILRNGGDWLRLRVTVVTDSQHLMVICSRDIPTDLAGATVALTEWANGVTVISGLDHLEGETVSILADGLVHPQRTVVSGSVTLQTPSVVVHAGLPMVAEMETLDVAVPGAVVRDKEKVVGRVTLQLERSRGVWIGDRGHEVEYKPRSTENYDDPPASITDAIEIRPSTSWNKHGRLVVQQRDPLPLTVLSIIPEVSVAS